MNLVTTPFDTSPADPANIRARQNSLILTLNSYVGQMQNQPGNVGNTSDTTSDTLKTMLVPPGFLAGYYNTSISGTIVSGSSLVAGVTGLDIASVPGFNGNTGAPLPFTPPSTIYVLDSAGTLLQSGTTLVQITYPIPGQNPGTPVGSGINFALSATATASGTSAMALISGIAGQRLRLTAWGTLGATSHSKTIGMNLGLIPGGTTLTGNVAITGTSTSNTGTWAIVTDLVMGGTEAAPVIQYLADVDLLGVHTVTAGTLTFSPSSAIPLSVVGQTNTAAASDVVCGFFGGEIIK
jgi:hypothetical protein